MERFSGAPTQFLVQTTPTTERGQATHGALVEQPVGSPGLMIQTSTSSIGARATQVRTGMAMSAWATICIQIRS